MRIFETGSLASPIKLFIDLIYYLAIVAAGAFAIVTLWLLFLSDSRVAVQIPVQLELDANHYQASSVQYNVERAEFKGARGILTISGLHRVHILFQAGIGLLTLCVSLLVLNRLRAIFNGLKEQTPFIAANAARIRFIALVVILGEVLSKSLLAWSSSTFADDVSFSGLSLRTGLDLDGSILFLGLVLMIISEMVRLGSQMRVDMETARDIQFDLVPGGEFQDDQILINSHMQPANTVGGDYYDLIPLDENQIGVVIGDVSGKGLPAAMLMASLQGSLRTLISAGFRGRKLIGKLNSYLCENTPDNRLVTLFYGELDLSTGALRYVNAGHNAPLWLQGAGAIQELASTTMALGIAEDPTINDNTIQLQPKDQILLYTDGISEAFNKKLEAFGESRLSQSLLKHRELSPSNLIRSLLEDVRGFAGRVKQGDDMTIMVVRRVSPSSGRV